MDAELIDQSSFFSSTLPPTKTAFAAARLKILIPFFIDLFLFTVSLFYKNKEVIKTWKNLFLRSPKLPFLKSIFTLLKRYHFKHRIRPPTERKKKLMRANERYMTEKNYKPAF